jgi:hypothetical protein
VKTTTAAAAVAVRSRVNDPDATKANILDVATREFAELGFDGARIDAIAEQTKTSKAEGEINLDDLTALEAVQKMTESTFDYHMKNADVVRLVMVENIAKGRHMDELPSLEPLNSVLINDLRKVCDRGLKEGTMRKLNPTRLYMSIAALCFFNVSNRYTFQSIFKVDMTSTKAANARKAEVVEMILRYVKP